MNIKKKIYKTRKPISIYTKFYTKFSYTLLRSYAKFKLVW